MGSTQRRSPADQVAPNARLWADGGFIFAGAPNAVTSAAVIVHQVSMHRNITPRPGTRSSRVLSRASIGFTIIAQQNPLPARNLRPLTRIRRINRHRDRLERCLRTGRRCCTNRARVPSLRSQGTISRSLLVLSWTRFLPISQSALDTLADWQPSTVYGAD